MNPPSILPTLIALVMVFSAALQAQTPTPSPSPSPTPEPDPLLVYDLVLDKTGRSVNYTFFKDGYLVVDPDASSFTSIVVLTDPNTFQFYQASDFLKGTYNEIRDYAGNRNAVLFGATAGTSANSDNSALQVIGPIDKNTGVGGEMRAKYSETLRGYFMASGPEVSSGNGTNTRFEYGFAGFSRAKGQFNKNLSKQVNNAGLDMKGAVGFLEKYLIARGVVSASPSPSPSPTPSIR